MVNVVGMEEWCDGSMKLELDARTTGEPWNCTASSGTTLQMYRKAHVKIRVKFALQVDCVKFLSLYICR